VTLAILLTVFSILDALFTLTLLQHGGTELNPVMRYFLNNFHTGKTLSDHRTCIDYGGYAKCKGIRWLASALDIGSAGWRLRRVVGLRTSIVVLHLITTAVETRCGSIDTAPKRISTR